MILLVLFSTLGNAQASDDFNWLRDDTRENQEVKRYLQEKNEESDNYLLQLKPLQQKLLSSWQSQSPSKAEKPWRVIGNDEFKITQVKEGRVLLSRDRTTKQSKTLLNIEQRASSHDFYQLGSWALSHNGEFLAVTEDLTGTELYQITVIELASGNETILAKASQTTLLWSEDDQSIFTIDKNQQNGYSYELIKRVIAQPNKRVVLYREKSKDWLVSAYLASDRRYALIQSNNESASEQRILDLKSSELSLPLKSRQSNIEYYADIADRKLFINSNINGKFALYQTPLGRKSDWQQYYVPKEQIELKNFYLFESAMAVIEQNKGRKTLLVIPYNQGKKTRIALSEQGNVGWVSRVGDYASNVIRIRSMSLIQPAKWEEFNIETGKRTVLSQDTYPNYKIEDYQTQQILVDSNGVQVPVTLAYNKAMLKSDSPVVLYGYGAYGFTMKPYFMPQITSLMDRGIIYAIAHVRGGGFNGEGWHSSGRGKNKQQGINDYLAATKAVQQFKGGQRSVLAMGSSAGGTLVAAAINQQPSWYTAASLNVPFVDVVASMSDDSLPLTAQQYREWGNPNIAAQLKLMEAYDPVLNISAQSYPPMMVRVGWNDTRVPYWEGAKYLAKISQQSTAKKPYLLVTDFSSGHMTDRRKYLQHQAMDYTFLISQLKNIN
ncbi:S9 family peptidase [Psychromonas sp. Urea-02u-13]|nr:S9 family peptidase [Psychromonas sp. Urea-02u-13]